MKKKIKDHRIDELDLNNRIKSGEVTPVIIPRFSTTTEIIKYHFCSVIIQFKNENGLRQKDMAELLEINKSEVSKLFSYSLKEFSGERIFSFVDTLISKNSKVDLSHTWDQIKKQSEKLQKRLKSKEAS